MKRLHPLNPFTWKFSLTNRIAAVLVGSLLAGVAVGLPLIACGPFFPNSILLQGDGAVLQAPQARFRAELDRLKWEGPPGLIADEPAESLRQGTVDAEIHDLRRALGSISNPSPSTNEIADWVLAFSRKRADLEDYRNSFVLRSEKSSSGPEKEAADTDSDSDTDSQENGEEVKGVLPAFRLDLQDLPAAIPVEFRLYLEGAVAWHDERIDEARAIWESLLAMPSKERRFKSTWAAYMVGQSWHDVEPDRAADFYRRTRRLARDGFVDTDGLAVASLGWEAQLKFKAQDYTGAMRLYLDQYAAGSTNTSAQSLGLVAEAMLAGEPEIRLVVARDKTLRRVVTAWLLSRTSMEYSVSGGESQIPADSEALRWLETIEATGAGEVELAEQLALLAYQSAQWEVAERWVELSGDSAVAHWVRAKLSLREGRVEDAASELAEVIRALPGESQPAGSDRPATLADSLITGSDEITSGNEVRGELGVIRLSQGDFVQALDLLARGGFWQDAAYVAERVLTADELKTYVDRSWPETPKRWAQVKSGDAEDPATREAGTMESDSVGGQLRHLLGRRLTRINRGREATPYFPAEWRSEQRRLLGMLSVGEDEQRPARERASAWFAAAWLTKTNGMELIGTEVTPDWAIWDGAFEAGPTWEERRQTAGRWLKPENVEGLRAAKHSADPEVRFHYRNHAALLAWNAAALLPNNDEETARILYDAGCWLKARDPETADLFYKALVKRCRTTELGEAADRQRWFPPLDDTGRPMVTRGRQDAAPTHEPVLETLEPVDPPGAEEEIEAPEMHEDTETAPVEAGIE